MLACARCTRCGVPSGVCSIAMLEHPPRRSAALLRYWPAGLSASTVASHELGEPKAQAHCGSTEPVLACTPNCPTLRSELSLSDMMVANPAGGSRLNGPDRVTAYASEPVSTVIAPGSAIVWPVP